MKPPTILHPKSMTAPRFLWTYLSYRVGPLAFAVAASGTLFVAMLILFTCFEWPSWRFHEDGNSWLLYRSYLRDEILRKFMDLTPPPLVSLFYSLSLAASFVFSLERHVTWPRTCRTVPLRRKTIGTAAYLFSVVLPAGISALLYFFLVSYYPDLRRNDQFTAMLAGSLLLNGAVTFLFLQPIGTVITLERFPWRLGPLAQLLWLYALAPLFAGLVYLLPPRWNSYGLENWCAFALLTVLNVHYIVRREELEGEFSLPLFRPQQTHHGSAEKSSAAAHPPTLAKPTSEIVLYTILACAIPLIGFLVWYFNAGGLKSVIGEDIVLYMFLSGLMIGYAPCIGILPQLYVRRSLPRSGANLTAYVSVMIVLPLIAWTTSVAIVAPLIDAIPRLLVCAFGALVCASALLMFACLLHGWKGVSVLVAAALLAYIELLTHLEIFDIDTWNTSRSSLFSILGLSILLAIVTSFGIYRTLSLKSTPYRMHRYLFRLQQR